MKKIKIMEKLDITGQKIKGQAQQIKGKIEKATGNTVGGTVDQIKGKANVAIADIRSKV
ncbi:MAG: hypothetical protein ACMG6E_05735 [Candidatus Roizmanbacteria bacterium]